MEDEQRGRKRIEEEVLRTLESTDDLTDVAAGPNFYSMVWQKLTATERAPGYWLGRLLFDCRWAPALLAVSLVLNVVTAWMIVRMNNERRAEYRQDYIEAVLSESSLAENPLSLVPESN